MTPQQTVRTLARRYPLAPDWSEPEVVAGRAAPLGLELARVGLSSCGPGGREAIGSAAETGRSPVARGYFELLERVGIMEALRDPDAEHEVYDARGAPLGTWPTSEVFPRDAAPARRRHALSNGVALHTDRRRAFDRALWELVERDRVLRAWHGELTPAPAKVVEGLAPLEASGRYDVRAATIPERREHPWYGAPVAVAVVVAFPRDDEAPLLRGFAARPAPAEALDAAADELLQGLAFLWDEELPDALPRPAPHPLFHLEHFLHPSTHAPLREWLRDGHGRYGAPRARTGGAVVFADLTPAPLWGRVHVVKALCSAAEPLVFGEPPERTAHLPAALRVHPIA